jgi:hypothetical protein
MKWILSFLICTSAFADQAVNVNLRTVNGTISSGCEQMIFIMAGSFDGNIGNATFTTSASTDHTVIPITAVQDGTYLSSITYTIGHAGKIYTMEVR